VREIYRSPRRLYVKLEREQVGIRCPTPDSAGATLLALTGSAAHIEQLSELARRRGWVLDREGLHRGGGASPLGATEEAIYAALDLPFVPPEIREGGGELKAAVEGTLPALIEASHIRGDLHVHTRWSDGRDSTEAMVLAALALGYEYVAITDHSHRAGSSRTLSIQDIPRQADEIARLRERHQGITVLHGCEVDIMPDGRLDFADEILEQFDIVLASLHDGAGHRADRLLQRYLEAMRNPFVTIVTHPTNRQFPHRRGYEIDYDRLFAAAVETRTVLEIDGGPGHLDLDSGLARRAIAAGATVSIDSDAHGAAILGRQMRLGLLTARAGWVERRHVLNARPLADVVAWIRAKRTGSRSNA
jgi:DNA polymerase (family 10)